ncbi:TPA: hypothetical protein ACMFP1_002895 [Pseudomonas aeruginosa]
MTWLAEQFTLPWYAYVVSMITSFTSVFLKGFQHKNVIGNHYRATFVTSFCMAAFDVASVSFIVNGGWVMFFPSGVGASFGMIAAMRYHGAIVGWLASRKEN